MRWAILNGDRSEAVPGARGECPVCGLEVIAKCGSIVTPHWAHLHADCDPWSEPETLWHREWKSEFPQSCQEVVVGPHRADVMGPNGHVLELQHSSISPETIEEREDFYETMTWLIDASEFRQNIEFRWHRDRRYWSFRWKHPRKSWWAASRPIVLHLGYRGLFRIRKLHDSVPCRGWGEWWNFEDLADHLGAGLSDEVTKLRHVIDLAKQDRER